MQPMGETTVTLIRSNHQITLGKAEPITRRRATPRPVSSTSLLLQGFFSSFFVLPLQSQEGKKDVHNHFKFFILIIVYYSDYIIMLLAECADICTDYVVYNFRKCYQKKEISFLIWPGCDKINIITIVVGRKHDQRGYCSAKKNWHEHVSVFLI